MACPNGTYAGIKQTTCTTCPYGHYCPTEKTVAPIPCSVGRYANETGSVLCSICEAGFKCLDASVTPVSCENGTVSIQGSTICSGCPAGYRYV